MKVNYPIEGAVDIKEIKAALKQFGGRCAKVVENTLEYQIKEENKDAAHKELKEKGYIK